MSIRDQIMKAKDISGKKLEIKEWDVTVEVRTMTARERAQIVESAIDPNTGKTSISIMYPEIAVACVYDPETGEKVFSADDKELLLDKSGAALEKIAQLAMEISGMTEASGAQLGKDS